MQTMAGQATDKRIDLLEGRMDERFDRVDGEFTRIDARFQVLEADVREIRGDVRTSSGSSLLPGSSSAGCKFPRRGGCMEDWRYENLSDRIDRLQDEVREVRGRTNKVESWQRLQPFRVWMAICWLVIAGIWIAGIANAGAFSS